MSRIMLIAGVLAVGLAPASPGDADELRYWGKQAGATTGWVEMESGQYHEVRQGTEISGLGTVKEISDSYLVVERARTEEEKNQSREAGALVYDIVEIVIPREGLRRIPTVSPLGPRQSR